MSPSTVLSMVVSTRSRMFCSFRYPCTGALFNAVKEMTVYFLPPLFCDFTLESLAEAAACRNPYGTDIIKSSARVAACGELAGTAWSCRCSPTTGCWPPPRGGSSPCVRIRWMRDAGAVKSMRRVYVLSLNFGHGASGRGAWPSTKSSPEPEYSIAFKFSAPNALDALAMTVLTSAASLLQDQAVQLAAAINERTRIDLVVIHASRAEYSERDSILRAEPARNLKSRTLREGRVCGS